VNEVQKDNAREGSKIAKPKAKTQEIVNVLSSHQIYTEVIECKQLGN
jgi:hypothetical protein